MNLESIIRRMEQFPQALQALAGQPPPEDARQRGPAGQWSILEIVSHLADEEEADFRVRVRLTLEDPEQDWPPIDPEGWARDRRYNERDLSAEFDRFAAARADSLAWLRSLKDPDWRRFREHPHGRLSAGDLMASWAAHDALHLRQIAKRLYELARRDAPGCDVGYAGPWERPTAKEAPAAATRPSPPTP
jgi:hypothetical protein